MTVGQLDDVPESVRDKYLNWLSDYNNLDELFGFSTEVFVQLLRIGTMANLIKGVEASSPLNFDPDETTLINRENKLVQVIVHEAKPDAKINGVAVKAGSRVRIDAESSMTGVKTAIIMFFRSKS